MFLHVNFYRWIHFGSFSELFLHHLQVQISQNGPLAADGCCPTIHQSEEKGSTEERKSSFHQQMESHNVKLLGGEALASGNFGSVWKGVWNGELVAVKQVKQGLVAQLYNEITIMRYVFQRV